MWLKPTVQVMADHYLKVVAIDVCLGFRLMENVAKAHCSGEWLKLTARTITDHYLKVVGIDVAWVAA